MAQTGAVEAAPPQPDAQPGAAAAAQRSGPAGEPAPLGIELAQSMEHQHPSTATAIPASGGDGTGQPIMLDYACGNRFVVSSAYQAPITVAYRVAGTGETGSIHVAAAPVEEPGISEAIIDARSTGTLTVSYRGQVASLENPRVPCAPATAAAAAASRADALAPASAGQWTAPFSWPAVAVHLTLLPNGQVMSWGNGVGGPPRIWDPATGVFSSSAAPNVMFCGGETFLADGRLLAAGGTLTKATFGRPNINLFTASPPSWATSASMARGRWYPTTTTMGNGDVVIIAGTDENAVNVPVPEVWSSPGTIRSLTGARLALPYYARSFLAPNGKLFVADGSTSRYLDVTGTGKWTNVANRKFASRGYGTAVMYQPGKIIYAGGSKTTNTAEIIDLNAATPAWQYTAPMAFARRNHNLTILADGKLLATDGVGGTAANDLTKAVLAAESWDPATGTWTTMASAAIPRGYHSTAILLPDGRVLQSGGGNGGGAPNQKNAEIYSPPYLFAGARPTITAAPVTTGYGGTFDVTTPDAASITKISLIRLGTATHAFNMNQRYQTLSFTSGASGLTVTAPSDRNITPPGHYLLFILNGSGVPSVAKIIQIT